MATPITETEPVVLLIESEPVSAIGIDGLEHAARDVFDQTFGEQKPTAAPRSIFSLALLDVRWEHSLCLTAHEDEIVRLPVICTATEVEE